MRAQAPFGKVEVVQRGRDIAAQCADPAKVLIHEPQRQVQVEFRAQLRGLVQVGLGGGELLPIAVQHRPVAQNLVHPPVIVGAAQDGKRSLIIGERLIEPAK